MGIVCSQSASTLKDLINVPVRMDLPAQMAVLIALMLTNVKLEIIVQPTEPVEIHSEVISVLVTMAILAMVMFATTSMNAIRKTFVVRMLLVTILTARMNVFAMMDTKVTDKSVSISTNVQMGQTIVMLMQNVLIL